VELERMKIKRTFQTLSKSWYRRLSIQSK